MSFGKPKTWFEISWVKNHFFLSKLFDTYEFFYSKFIYRVNSDNNGHIT